MRVFSRVTTHKSLERPTVRRLCRIASEIYDDKEMLRRKGHLRRYRASCVASCHVPQRLR